MLMGCCHSNRYEELEREQMAGRSPAETPEPEKPIVDASIGGSAAAKKVQRMERTLRLHSNIFGAFRN